MLGEVLHVIVITGCWILILMAIFAKRPPEPSAVEDVDGDGDLDFIVHSSRQEIRSSGALDEESVDAALSAETLDGTEVFGIDSIRIVP